MCACAHARISVSVFVCVCVCVCVCVSYLGASGFRYTVTGGMTMVSGTKTQGMTGSVRGLILRQSVTQRHLVNSPSVEHSKSTICQ